MTAQARLLTTADRTGEGGAACDRALLEVLRACARAAQRGPRVDPERAAAADGVTLISVLDGAALRRLTFHPRGAAEVAFGEAWVLRLLTALRAGDHGSARFLIERMVRRDRRRLVWTLAARLATAGNPGAADLESFQAGKPVSSQPAS